MPPGFLDSGFSGQAGTAQASTTVTAVDPVMAQMLRQQMLLTQRVVDLLYRTGPRLQQQPVQQTQQQRRTLQGRLSWQWKSWNNRARELSGFKGWLEKFASWLCLVHDYASELKEAMNLPYPVVIVNQDHENNSQMDRWFEPNPDVDCPATCHCQPISRPKQSKAQVHTP